LFQILQVILGLTSRPKEAEEEKCEEKVKGSSILHPIMMKLLTHPAII
jgi:hypothetical protein